MVTLTCHSQPLASLVPERRPLSVQDLLIRYSNPFRFDRSIPYDIRNVLDKLIECRRGGYGSSYYECDGCGEGAFHYSQCNDRHCPSCGWSKRKAWVSRIESWALPATYFHTVFTVPHQLNPLLLANRSATYGLFFRRAQKTLLEICEREFQCKPGILLTLHTWGQRMLTHVHIHAIMTAGGVSLGPKKSWVPIGAESAGFHEQGLADLFQKKLLRGLRILCDQGKLQIPHELAWAGVCDRDSFHRWLDPLGEIRWKSDAQITPEGIKNHVSCIHYLSNYIQGTAISDARIKADDGTNVTISLWDYRRGEYVLETMPGVEFVRRFLLHIVPGNIHRVRYAGLFQAKGRTETLAQVRGLLETYYRLNPNTRHPALRGIEQQSTSNSQKLECQLKCKRCGSSGTRFVRHLGREETLGRIMHIKKLIELYSYVPTTLDQVIQAANRIRGLEPKQGWLEDWQHATAVRDLYEVLFADGAAGPISESQSAEAFGVIECCVNYNLPVPDT